MDTARVKADVIVFISQVAILFLVVVTSLVNLSLNKGNTNLWTMVLTSCLGYMLPNPRLKRGKEIQADDVSRNVVLRNLAVERTDSAK